MTKLLVKLGLLAAMIVLTAFASLKFLTPGSTRQDDRLTISLLKTEALSFLVTRRTTTQLVVEHSESSLFGGWDGVYWVTVRWNWGVDMSKLQDKDFRREGEVIVCHLPEPELLEFNPMYDTEGFYSKSTVLPKLKEMFNGGRQKAQLRDLLLQKAMKFAQQEHLCPTRAQIAEQLGKSGAMIKRATGTEIRFE